MNEEQMKDFVKSRIELINNGSIKDSLAPKNGLLVHIIPSILEVGNIINWTDKKLNHEFIIKHSFRKFSDLDSTFDNLGDRILGYTPRRILFNCFQSGIIETYKHPLDISNLSGSDLPSIKVDNIFYQIRNTLEAAKNVHEKIFKSNPPYYIFITCVGISGTYFYSLDKKYNTTVPFPFENARFEHFLWNDLKDNIMPEIINGVHYGIRVGAKE